MYEKTISATDWTDYYTQKKSFFSKCTQKHTLRLIKNYVEKYHKKTTSINVIELGGGNSCFAQALIDTSAIPITKYSIIDNCELAIRKFEDMKINGNAYCIDITSQDALSSIDEQFDFVYSVGLIEHFRGADIAQIIESHFTLCRTNGLVLISVPTPTFQYRIVRKCMELLNVWRFPDEKPLKATDIYGYINNCGKIIDCKINYKLPLTQLMIVAIKN